MSNKIIIYINGEPFSSYDCISIDNLDDAKNAAYKFMNDKFGHIIKKKNRGFFDSEVKVSFFNADDGSRTVKIKIFSKELTREIILSGLLKDDDGTLR